MRAKLTKRLVESLQAGPRELFVWDTALPGFGLRLQPSGRRYYVVQYQNRQGRARRLTLGPHGALTVDQARRLAGEKLGAARMGRDPAEERAAERRAVTFAQLAQRYRVEHLPRNKPRTQRENARILDRELLPALGRYQVASLTAAEVARLHAGLRSRPVMANRALALLSSMLTLAERWGLRPLGSNPCRGLQRNRERPRSRFLSDRELAKLGTALAELEAEGKVHATAAAAIRLLALTGARRGEILGLRWEEVNFERGYLRLADSKTGAKALPLSAPAAEILAKLPRAGPYVLQAPEDAPRPILDLRRPWGLVLERAGLAPPRGKKAARAGDPASAERIRLHDLRHTHASAAAGAGLSLPLIGALLGHKNPATTQRYAHLADDPLKQGAERVAARISAALERREQADVRAIRPER